MNSSTLVSDEFAKKFASEKGTPYERWVQAEGLDIISGHYVPNLRNVDLKPWARRGGRARRVAWITDITEASLTAERASFADSA